MTQKTAMQELYNKLCHLFNESEYNEAYRCGVLDATVMVKSMLEKEKQQIIDAVNYATPYYEYQFDQQTGMITIISGENYYNQTYGGNK